MPDPAPAVALCDDMQILAAAAVGVYAPQSGTTGNWSQRKENSVALGGPERPNLTVRTAGNIYGTTSFQGQHENIVCAVFRADERNVAAVRTDRRSAQASPFIENLGRGIALDLHELGSRLANKHGP